MDENLVAIGCFSLSVYLFFMSYFEENIGLSATNAVLGSILAIYFTILLK